VPAGDACAKCTAAGDQTPPRVTYGGGNWFVVWGDFRSVTESDLYGARVSTAGTVLDSAGIAISTEAGDQGEPWVTSDDGFALKVPIDASGIGHAWGLPPGRYTVREGSQQLAHFEVTADTTLLTVDVP